MHGSLLAGRRCNCTSQLVGGTVVGCLPQGDCLTLWICAKCLFNKAERIFTEERSPSRRRWAALLMLVGWYRAQQRECSAHLCLTACYACTESHFSSWGRACVCTTWGSWSCSWSQSCTFLSAVWSQDLLIFQRNSTLWIYMDWRLGLEGLLFSRTWSQLTG